MKNLLALFVTCLLTLNVFSQTLKKTYYDTWERVVHEVYYENSAGYGHGSYKKYDRKGVLIETGTFSNGEKTGEWIKYTTASGQRKIDYKETYKDGKLNGPVIYYFENNDGRVVQSKGNYVDGKKNGKFECINRFYEKDFDEKGFSSSAKFIKFDKFYQNGEEVFPDGEHKIYFYPSNKIYCNSNYENGRLSGNQVCYYPDGTIRSEQHYDTAEEIKIKEEKAKIEEEKAKIQRQIEKEKKDKALIIANNTLDSNKVEKAIELYQNIGVNTEYLNFFLVLKRKYENGIIELGTTSITYDKYGNRDNTMGTQLVRQLMNNALRRSTLKAHQDFCLRYIEIKELEILEIEKVNKEVQDSYNSYIKENVKEVKTTVRSTTTGKFIVNTTYLKNKIIYTKSIIILEAYIEEFNKATSLAMKQEYGKKVIGSINTLNQIPKSDWKDLKKQLKKVEDPEQIKTILKI